MKGSGPADRNSESKVAKIMKKMTVSLGLVGHTGQTQEVLPSRVKGKVPASPSILFCPSTRKQCLLEMWRKWQLLTQRQVTASQQMLLVHMRKEAPCTPQACIQTPSHGQNCQLQQGKRCAHRLKQRLKILKQRRRPGFSSFPSSSIFSPSPHVQSLLLTTHACLLWPVEPGEKEEEEEMRAPTSTKPRGLSTWIRTLPRILIASQLSTSDINVNININKHSVPLTKTKLCDRDDRGCTGQPGSYRWISFLQRRHKVWCQ